MIKYRYIPKSNFYVASWIKHNFYVSVKVMFYPIVSSESEKMGVDHLPRTTADWRQLYTTMQYTFAQHPSHTTYCRTSLRTTDFPDYGLRYYGLISDRSRVRIHTSCTYEFLIHNIVFNISLFKRLFVKKLCVCLIKKLKFKNVKISFLNYDWTL